MVQGANPAVIGSKELFAATFYGSSVTCILAPEINALLRGEALEGDDFAFCIGIVLVAQKAKLGLGSQYLFKFSIEREVSLSVEVLTKTNLNNVDIHRDSISRGLKCLTRECSQNQGICAGLSLHLSTQTLKALAFLGLSLRPIFELIKKINRRLIASNHTEKATAPEVQTCTALSTKMLLSTVAA